MRFSRPVVTRRLMPVLSGLALLLAAAFGSAQPAAAADDSPPIYTITWGGGGDTFDNYDFHWDSGSQTLSVDWGVDLIFANAANVPEIRTRMASQPSFSDGWGGTMGGGTEWGWIANHSEWQGSSGEKQASGCNISDTYHMRQYAHGQYASYDRNIGFYVFATSHDDHYEGCGYTEETETSKWVFANIFRQWYSVSDDYWGLSNTEEGCDSHGKCWDNNGWATQIWMT